MTITKKQKDNITFTPLQLQYLERFFPRVVHGPNVTENEMRHYNGQQSVMDTIRRLTDERIHRIQIQSSKR